ncbi:hypothetical protein IAD21_00482 [Abditibacteriota bacterium]|nr:hypothetical protein IAD21_00482 [Abditibacteriota bacterium]
MKTNTLTNQIKKVVALTALTIVPVSALISSAQAAPKKNYVAMQHESIIAKKNPAIYDGPHYGGPIAKVNQGQVAAHVNAHVATQKIANQKAAH